ncbi:hypothetical protein KO493_03435 [Tamlana agarivorans]|uniref:Uncharacterized protein n=1 Tax=Pseudotamlana agarivorans TaxID=481183 RepID=A0ACC5U5Z9_9FLAO|nr:hypothetical protein [Tamlana agarivorans]MBU2949747.1 hypothetical protein [Tamlana agarivorans]
MKINLTTLVFLISVACFSQNFSKKKQYYFQDNLITEAQFKSLDKRKIYTKTIENDTLRIEQVYRHKKIGKLDSIQFHQINMLLKKMVGTEFNPEIKTMIHLYSNNDKAIYRDSKNKKYWKWIKTNANRYQSFLIGTKTSRVEPQAKNHIYLDQYNVLERLFFKDSEFKTNHLLIKPDAEIYTYFGLEDISYVLDASID